RRAAVRRAGADRAGVLPRPQLLAAGGAIHTADRHRAGAHPHRHADAARAPRSRVDGAMTRDPDDAVEFDEMVMLALSEAAIGPEPRPEVKQRLMARIAQRAPLPAGYALRFERDDDWMPHPVPGIRMKILAVNRRSGYATLLLDVQPGTRFPAHHHDG